MYFCAGFASFEKLLHGKSTVAVLVLLLAIALAPWFVVWYQPPGYDPHTVKMPSLPAIPAAFTGRSEQIQWLIHYVVIEHISIVAVTGGPGYGKSSVAIVSSHELVKLGIPVYYVSLSEVNSIEAFVMTFMQAVGRKVKNEQLPGKGEFLSWTSSLDFKTVVVLDNADLLTLMRTDLRNDFLQLLKDATARSSSIHFVVATRYRFKYANDFAEIHLSTLDSADAIALLRRVVLSSRQTSDNMDGSLKDEHLKGIANRTGGIPLALKVVGELVKSGIVSTAEVLNELAVNPMDALSRESFPPDEQLKRCFSLSYQHLNQSKRNCLIYASRFPGAFDRRARDAIITTMTGDLRCLDQLVDRSLVEYSSADERYTMHSLLRNFVANSVEERPPKRKYFRLFCSHYIHLLSACITEARTGGDVDHLYATISADYHNFLHVLHIYTNESTRDYLPAAVHKKMLLFANQAFEFMKSRFPWELLVNWWTMLLSNICRLMMSISELQLFASEFLQLSTKFGNLFFYHKQYQLAGKFLEFADQCVMKDRALAESFTTCQHPQADSYTGMLQALMKVYEEEGLVHSALEVRERLHLCVDLAPDKNPEDLIPDDFCTVGITYLEEKHSQSRDFASALQFFDANLKCFGFWDEGVDNWIKMLEVAYDDLVLDSHLAGALGIAKRCYMTGRFRKELVWLMKAVLLVESTPITDKKFVLFLIHFRLTCLHWIFFHNVENAVEHGKAAYNYSQAIQDTTPIKHTSVWKASLRLADILHQIDGNQQEAVFYFEEVIRHSPFLIGDTRVIYEYQKFAELHLIYLYYHAGQHRQFIQHYGQWANLEVRSVSNHIRKIVNRLFSEPIREANVGSLVVTDSSLDWLLGGSSIARRFLHAFVHKAQYSTMYYAKMFFIVVVLGCIIALVIRNVMMNAWDVFQIILFTRIAHFIFMYHFCFHYFLYHALTKKKVWAPRQLPHLHPIIELMYKSALHLCTICVIAILTMFGLLLLNEQVKNVDSPYSLYHNMSMGLIDNVIYDLSFVP